MSSSSSTEARDTIQKHEPEKKSSGWGDYGGNPLAHINSVDSARLPALGAALQPGLYRPPKKTQANPAPLGLAGFALTTFVLSLINIGVRGVTAPNIVVGPAFAYGGLVQLLAGMWEVAMGNTFGAWALSSYGGFWISLAIILTPGGFDIAGSYDSERDFLGAFGFFLIAWSIYTFIVWTMTLRSTLVFSTLFFTVAVALMCLGVANILATNNATGAANVPLTQAGGYIGVVASFLAWYLMLAGLMDESNSFFELPVLHFPWSEKGRAARRQSKAESDDAV